MAKIIDLLKVVSSVIPNAELQAIMSKENPLEEEISTDDFDKIEESFKGLFMFESAIANQEIKDRIQKDVFPSHKKTVLSQIEEIVKPIAGKLNIDISGEEFAIEQLKIVSDSIDEKLASVPDRDWETHPLVFCL